MTTSAPGDDASLAGHNGWRQASIGTAALLERLREEGIEPPTSRSVPLILSHDCDVVNRSFEKEPWVEFAWLEPIAKPDGHKTLGKSSRVLHLGVRTAEDDEVWFELAAASRFSANRRVLVAARPSDELRVPTQSKRLLASWIAKRYDRSAFPDAFNDRLPKGRRLARPLKEGGSFISELYLAITEEELPTDEPYRVLLRAVMTVEDFADPDRRVQADHCLQELEALLAECEGIEVVESYLQSEQEVTLDDLRSLKRWDFDWLSIPEAQD